MILIPGIVISVLTFPGVIVHELGHLVFCMLRKVPVFEVKFFQFDMKAQGYVLHAPTESYATTFLVAVGPLVLNTLLCLLICFPASLPFWVFEDRGPVTIVLLWLGVSIGMHAFPSTGDAQGLWKATKEAMALKNPLAIAGVPVVGLIYLANILSVVWFDAIFGAAVGLGIPMLVFRAF